MFWATSVGRVAAIPKTEAPRYVPYGFSARAGPARNEAIAAPACPSGPGRTIDRERAVRAADVVVEDSSTPAFAAATAMSIWYWRTTGLAKFVKPPYRRTCPAGRLDHLVAGCVLHAYVREDRVVEADEPADHAHALACRYGRLGEVDVGLTAPISAPSGTGAFQPTCRPSSFRSSSTALIRPWSIRSSDAACRRPSGRPRRRR
jgi:hypothetical protein